ncbi:AbrB/MazE/SpoVT family DNA-binding domain-containing protein [Clostridium sp. LP20]|uniref:AbrB/MazE/SpoVT family DNA-binding domain-containing protein n=1 Tax=Clostridium sp. LP20 TaxID=3418665 RepID=UPI003EE43A22
MKSTGIVRRTDELGRIVIPKELRRTMDINEGDPVEIYTEGEDIILRKYSTGCYICGEEGNLEGLLGRQLCPVCLEEAKRNIEKILGANYGK